MNQEPNELSVIAENITKYFQDFILFEKVDVKGGNIHPLYKYLTEKKSGWLGKSIKWNFTKFLIDKEGNVDKRYGPGQSIPIKTIESLLI